MCLMPASALVPATWLRWPSSSRCVSGASALGGGDSHQGPCAGVVMAGGWCRLSTAIFLWKGVDVIVNASSVEDIDAGAIGQRLSNGLARLSSPVLHRLRLREDENAEPVVSVCLAPVGSACVAWCPSLACPVPLSSHPLGVGGSWGIQPAYAGSFDTAGHHLPEDGCSCGNEAD